MQVLKDAVIINISPSQQKIFRDGKYNDVFHGVELAEHGSNRPRIPVTEIGALVERLRHLQATIVDDPDHRARHPRKVIDQIILKIRDAEAAQKRTYP
jgi:hypothetical protein